MGGIRLSQKGEHRRIRSLGAAQTVVLVVDVLLGAPIIKNSILGYDPIVAARFYGIGNEYMGVLIGTTLIGTTGLLDRWALRLSPAVAG